MTPKAIHSYMKRKLKKKVHIARGYVHVGVNHFHLLYLLGLLFHSLYLLNLSQRDLFLIIHRLCQLGLQGEL